MSRSGVCFFQSFINILINGSKDKLPGIIFIFIEKSDNESYTLGIIYLNGWKNAREKDIGGGYLFFLILFFLALTVNPLFADSVGAEMYVNVQQTSLKAGTGFFARKTGTLSYGDKVEVLSEKSKWYEVVSVSDSSVRGWMPASSLTKKKIVLSGDRNAVSASADELALAGKGFSADAEKVFRSNDAELRYDLVDKIEKNAPQLEDVYSFVVEGNLERGEE